MFAKISVGDNNDAFKNATVTYACFIGASDEDDVYWNLSDDGVLTIYGNGKMKDFDPANGDVAPWGKAIEKLIVEDGVTKIGKNSFDECKQLSEVSLADSITEIGKVAFTFCSFTELKLPKKLEKLGNSAFYHCNKLKEIEVPKTVNCIEDYAFNQCEKLSSAKVLADAATLGNYMFMSCSNLENVWISGNVSKIGCAAFATSGVKNIWLPKSISQIDSLAFNACKSLENVYFDGKKSDFDKITVDDMLNDDFKNAKVIYSNVGTFRAEL